MLFTSSGGNGNKASSSTSAAASGGDNAVATAEKANLVVYHDDEEGGVGECDDEDLRLLESMGSGANSRDVSAASEVEKTTDLEQDEDEKGRAI
jgi:hypothetical protein